MTPRRKRLLTPPSTPRRKLRGFMQERVSKSGRTYYTRPSPSTGSRSVQRFAAQAAGGMLGFIHGNVPGIVQGAHYAGKAFDYFKPKEVDDEGIPLTQKNNSMYSGKFKKPKPYDQSLESKILKEGYMCTSEVHGKVTDAYCAYIQHSTWWGSLMARSLAGALLRKLFKKAGLEISDRLGTLPLFSVSDGSGFRIEYNTINPSTNVITTVTYDTAVGSTIDSIITLFGIGFTDQIEGYLNASFVAQPHSISLYAHDNNGFAVNYRLCSTIKIGNEVVHYHASSVLKLQNRTQADLSEVGNFNSDRLDNQPVVCTIYSFPGPPLLKHTTPGSTTHTLQGVTLAGLKLFGSAAMPGDISFENRPDVAIFANCNKKSNNILQPGQMKTSYCKYDFSGKIVNVLPKQRLESNTGGVVTGVKCKTELIVFEEIMRTEGTNPIHINYERHFKIGCTLTTKKDNFAIQPKLLTSMLNYP